MEVHPERIIAISPRASRCPHGVYDYFDNAGFMTLDASRETGAFVCDAIALAWEEDRKARYLDAEEILSTLDVGGTNIW